MLESLSLFKNSGQVTIVPNDAEILICLSTLDRIYADEKRPVEAAAIRRKLIKLIDRVYGADSFQTGQALFQIAQAEMAQNRPDEGIPLIRRFEHSRESKLNSSRSGNVLSGSGPRNMPPAMQILQ